jgi:homoserine dehydrogenase
VLPTLVAADSALGRTGGVLNRIEIDASPVGTVAFAGPGAGGAATSSAVLGDLMAIARGLRSTWAGLPPAERAERADRLDRADSFATPAAELSPAGSPDR